jgi:hypothetical protein
MAETECACELFEQLEGAAAQAYTLQFLEKTDVDEKTGKTHYLCRICGRAWVRETIEGNRKPSLVRQEMEFDV